MMPSPIDIRAAQRFLGELRNLRNIIGTDIKMATVANRVREGTLIANELEDYLYELKLPSGRKFPFLTVLRSSTNYLRAAERGLSIFEFAPIATATDREYWSPLTRWLQLNGDFFFITVVDGIGGSFFRSKNEHFLC